MQSVCNHPESDHQGTAPYNPRRCNVLHTARARTVLKTANGHTGLIPTDKTQLTAASGRAKAQALIAHKTGAPLSAQKTLSQTQMSGEMVQSSQCPSLIQMAHILEGCCVRLSAGRAVPGSSQAATAPALRRRTRSWAPPGRRARCLPPRACRAARTARSATAARARRCAVWRRSAAGAPCSPAPQA